MNRLYMFLLTLLISNFLFATENTFRFHHITVENGLPSNCVRAILQDKKGFLWFGTDEGLACYDGVSMKVYKQNRDKNGLLHYDIGAIYQDNNEDLWLGTDHGITIFDYRTATFRSFDIKTDKGININTNVSSLTSDKEGNLWISTVNQGVFNYNMKSHELIQYRFSEHLGYVSFIFVDSGNRVWVTVSNHRFPLYKLNRVNNTFEPFKLYYTNGVRDSQSLSIGEDSSHFLWLGTWDGGLQKVDRFTGETTSYLLPKDEKVVKHIHSIMKYSSNQLLLGTDDGLILFNTDSGDYHFYTCNETNALSLSDRFIYPIIKDTEGGIWIGTYYGGVNYVSPDVNQFECFSHSQFENSVNGKVINRFCEGKDGNIWIASDDGGLNLYSPKSGLFRNYMPANNKNSLSFYNVHALCLDNDKLWVGTYTGGLNVLDTNTGFFKVYSHLTDNSSSIGDASVYAIFKDRENRIWIGTMAGIDLYDRAKDNFLHIKRTGIMVIDIDQDKSGNIWFSTQGDGIYKYDVKNKSWKHYIYSKDINSLPNNTVNNILVDARGDIWVGTMDGLCKYNFKKDNFERIRLDIPSNNICCVLEDQHVFWITTTNGLVKYTPGEGCKVYTKRDGLQNGQFLPNSGIKTSDGKIYIGSVNGFNSFYSYRIRLNHIAPPVYITGLEIFNKKVNVGSKLLPKALQETNQLDLSYKDNVISLIFSSLSYCIPQKNQYAYKMVGFDKDWNYVGSQNKATYTNLPAGTYVFKVKGTNNDGIWNEKDASIKIVVHPPFYLTAGFKIFYFILLLSVIGFFIRYLLWRSEKKNAEVIRQMNLDKEKEVQKAKIGFFTMIAHEIRTPVSLIIGPLEKILSKTSELPQGMLDDLNIIERNSRRLLSLVNQLLDFRKIEQGPVQINCATLNISQLMRTISERFDPFVKLHGAELKVEYPDEHFTADVDAEAITKVVSNLLTNACKFTKDEVKLSCFVFQERGEFMISVADNGRGIKKENQHKIFDSFYQGQNDKPGTGIGLAIVKAFVEAHRGYIEVESEEGKGAVFQVLLPIKQSGCLKEKTVIDASGVYIDVLPENHSLPSSGDKPMILVVDDNEEMLDFLSGSFSEQYKVLVAKDGIEALDILKSNDVILIVCDWMMPRMDGIELCKAIRSNQLTSHIPFILLTAKTDMHSRIEGMDCGADVYIEKPFSVQYLNACIKNLMDLRKQLREKFSMMPFFPLNSIAGNTADEEFLIRMNKIIEENFSNSDLSVDFLAKRLCISRSGLFAKIKNLANITPNELIQLVRLKKAATLLAEKKYRVNEISYMVGFNNPSYFSKCFLKQFGVKPADFTADLKDRPAFV